MKTAVRTDKQPTVNLELPFTNMAEGRIARSLFNLLERPMAVVFTDNSTVMISFKEKKGKPLELRLHHMFREADERIVEALGRYIQGKDGKCSAMLTEFINANKSLVRKSPSRRTININPIGKHHRLEGIYRRLNDSYFEGGLDVAITWGRRNGRKPRSHIRLGSYSFEDKIIRIHPVLDRKWVPKYYVESVVYHEMLHAYFQVSEKNGRRRYHTPEFRRWEKLHPNFEQSRQWEKHNIHRLLRARVL